MLDLCLKGIIDFDVIDSENINISLNYISAATTLPKDEKIVYDILIEAMGNNSTISINDFKRYYDENHEEVYQKLRSIKKETEMYEKRNGNIDTKKEKSIKKFNNGFEVCIAIWAGLLLFLVFAIDEEMPKDVSLLILNFAKNLPVFYIALPICAGVCLYNRNKVPNFSEKGSKEITQWRALTLYMAQYSSVEENKVVNIKLWEKFLVYATVMDVHEAFIEQLKIVHPETFVENKDDTPHRLWKFVCKDIGGKSAFEELTNQLRDLWR